MVMVVVDSSVIIEDIRRGSQVMKDLREGLSRNNVHMIIPSVVVLELWSGLSMEAGAMKERVKNLYSAFDILPLTETIAIRAGELVRRSHLHSIDAAIAATALEKNAWLATVNKKDFQKVPGLRLWE